jgi:hypothetical protein
MKKSITLALLLLLSPFIFSVAANQPSESCEELCWPLERRLNRSISDYNQAIDNQSPQSTIKFYQNVVAGNFMAWSYCMVECYNQSHPSEEGGIE